MEWMGIRLRLQFPLLVFQIRLHVYCVVLSAHLKVSMPIYLAMLQLLWAVWQPCSVELLLHRLFNLPIQLFSDWLSVSVITYSKIKSFLET